MTTSKKTKKTPAEALGANIRSRREELGLSQAQLAAKARMDPASISDLEAGRYGNRGPTLSTIDQIARALDTETALLFA